MLLTSAANSGFEHPCLGGRGDEGIGGQEGEPHHPPGVHLSLGGNCTAIWLPPQICMLFLSNVSANNACCFPLSFRICVLGGIIFLCFLGSSNVLLSFQCSNTSVLLQTKIDILQVYDAINDDVELPNIDYPDSDASKAIVEFHACKLLWPIVYMLLFTMLLK